MACTAAYLWYLCGLVDLWHVLCNHQCKYADLTEWLAWPVTADDIMHMIAWCVSADMSSSIIKQLIFGMFILAKIVHYHVEYQFPYAAVQRGMNASAIIDSTCTPYEQGMSDLGQAEQSNACNSCRFECVLFDYITTVHSNCSPWGRGCLVSLARYHAHAALHLWIMLFSLSLAMVCRAIYTTTSACTHGHGHVHVYAFTQYAKWYVRPKSHAQRPGQVDGWRTGKEGTGTQRSTNPWYRAHSSSSAKTVMQAEAIRPHCHVRRYVISRIK